MSRTSVKVALFCSAVALLVAGAPTGAQMPALGGMSFGPGDIFLSLENGQIQWRLPDGRLNRTLVATDVGTGEGMAFDAAGTLYVARWCLTAACGGGNIIETFNKMGVSTGRFGPEYNCSPHSILFEPGGAAYVGVAGCARELLRIVGGQTVAAFVVESENNGPFWIDLAPDGCTMFYTSWGPNVKRFDVCANAQLPDFNVAPMPGGSTGGGLQDLRILPDGGVLVASGDVVARLNAQGQLIQTYASTGESKWWTGLDLVGDGTFWAANYEASTVHRFAIDSGTLLASFSTGTPPHYIVGLRVNK